MTVAWVLSIHAAATLAMTGLVWFVQVVHYPLFERVGRDAFAAYHAGHLRLTGRVVIPGMLTELAAALVLLALPATRGNLLVWIGGGLLAVVWGSTFLFQVPRHRILERGFDGAAWRALVVGNRIRTAAWSARSILAVFLIIFPEGMGWRS